VARGAALVDLARQSPEEIRGPRGVWAAALALVSSLGALPTLYALFGRDRGQR
jgi:hypothetical protein